MSFYAASHPAGQVRELPGVSAISCGWNYPVFNSALLTSQVPGVDGELSNRIAMASIFFRALGMGWSYWACHDLLDATSLRVLRDTCYAYGMDPVLTAPGMYAEKLEPQKHAPPALEVKEVTDGASRTAFAHLVSTIFDLPFQMTMHVYGPAECWTQDYAGFIGYVDDRPVTIAMTNVHDSCCGFYSVGTVPGHRRKGYAEAVMRTAYKAMQNRLQFTACVLQSTTVGRRLYEQMGFREVTRFSVFRSAPG
ncbi:MAG: GNAT family N-acetyltransferase [Acidobacteria bacterium]|nr:GNAT family N-acetyltransferase [Acidobacteriota bacterium]